MTTNPMGMIEAVARAIDPDAFASWQRAYDWEMKQSGDKAEAKRFADWGSSLAPVYAKARAAIEAMRWPTHGMYEAAYDALVPAGDAQACWEAMIDAALSEPSP